VTITDPDPEFSSLAPEPVVFETDAAPALSSWEPEPATEPEPVSEPEPLAEPEPVAEPEPDKSELVNQVMARFGVPSWEAWAMTIPELIKKLED
jgi:hypothetical protein